MSKSYKRAYSIHDEFEGYTALKNWKRACNRTLRRKSKIDLSVNIEDATTPSKKDFRFGTTWDRPYWAKFYMGNPERYNPEYASRTYTGARKGYEYTIWK